MPSAGLPGRRRAGRSSPSWPAPIAPLRRPRPGPRDRASSPARSGFYPGSDVRILGVEVGKVTSVTPKGDTRRASTFEYDQVPVPADAKAAVVAPSLVSDRYVQLFPAYQRRPGAGRRGADPAGPHRGPGRARPHLAEPGRPLVALGPDGANKDGALSRPAATRRAANLDGNGQKLHDTIRDLSPALTTLSGGPRRPVRHGEEPPDLHHACWPRTTRRCGGSTPTSPSVVDAARRRARRPRGGPGEPRRRARRGVGASCATTAPLLKTNVDRQLTAVTSTVRQAARRARRDPRRTRRWRCQQPAERLQPQDRDARHPQQRQGSRRPGAARLLDRDRSDAAPGTPPVQTSPSSLAQAEAVPTASRSPPNRLLRCRPAPRGRRRTWSAVPRCRPDPRRTPRRQ